RIGEPVLEFRKLSERALDLLEPGSHVARGFSGNLLQTSEIRKPRDFAQHLLSFGWGTGREFVRFALPQVDAVDERVVVHPQHIANLSLRLSHARPRQGAPAYLVARIVFDLQ